MKGDFGLVYPGYTWRFKFQPTDVPDLLMVTLEIGYSAHQVAEQKTKPDQEQQFEEDRRARRRDDSPAAADAGGREFRARFRLHAGGPAEAQDQADPNGAGGGAGQADAGGAQGNQPDVSQLLHCWGRCFSGEFRPSNAGFASA